MECLEFCELLQRAADVFYSAVGFITVGFFFYTIESILFYFLICLWSTLCLSFLWKYILLSFLPKDSFLYISQDIEMSRM